MSIDLYEIARSMGRLDLLSPELAELEARHRLEERHAERMRELAEQRQNPALAAEIARLEQENADLKAKLAQANCDAEPGARHRNSLLRVIAALLELADLGQEEKPFTRANFIVNHIERNHRQSIKPETVANIIRDAWTRADEDRTD